MGDYSGFMNLWSPTELINDMSTLPYLQLSLASSTTLALSTNALFFHFLASTQGLYYKKAFFHRICA